MPGIEPVARIPLKEEREVVPREEASKALERSALRDDLNAVIAVHDQFVALKRALITKVGGIVQISGRPYVNKQGWLATGNFFKVSIESVGGLIVNQIPPAGDRPASVQVVVSMRARMGDRHFDAVGSVDTSEDFARRGNVAPENAEGATYLCIRKWLKEERRYAFVWSWHFPKPYSTLVGFAQTRAANRAIAGLLGLAEASAEEMIGAEDTGEDDVNEAPKATIKSDPVRKPVETTASASPDDPVKELFRLREKMIELVGTEATSAAFTGALRDAGIGKDVALYRKKDHKEGQKIATRQEVLQVWRSMQRAVERAEGPATTYSDEAGIDADEKGV